MKYIAPITSLIIGGLIYLYFRPDNLLIHTWITQVNFELDKPNFAVPYWIVYNLPDAIWTYAGTSIILILWSGKIEIHNISYIFTPLALALISEIGQLTGHVPGTFDIWDIVAYTSGAFIGLITFKS